MSGWKIFILFLLLEEKYVNTMKENRIKRICDLLQMFENIINNVIQIRKIYKYIH